MSKVPNLNLFSLEKVKLSEQEIIYLLHQNMKVKPENPEYKASYKKIIELLLDYIQRRSKRKNHQTRKQKFLERMDMVLFIAAKYDNRFWMTFAVKHGAHDTYYYHRYKLINGELIDVHEGCFSDEEREVSEIAMMDCATIEEAKESASRARLGLFLRIYNLDVDDDELSE